MLKHRVLMIGGDTALRRALPTIFGAENCDVMLAERGREGVRIAEQYKCDLILLAHDLAADPFEICREIRAKYDDEDAPVFLIVSGNGTLTEGMPNPSRRIINNLNALIESISSALYDPKPPGTDEQQIICGSLVIDRRKYRVTVDGREIAMTATEFRLLWLLGRNLECPVSRRDLTNACIRGSGESGRTVDSHVRSIRKKLGERAYLIETVRGIGYRLIDRNQRIANFCHVAKPAQAS